MFGLVNSLPFIRSLVSSRYQDKDSTQNKRKSDPLTMANTGLNRGLPKFLLPKISWQPIHLQNTTIRASSTLPNHSNRTSRARTPKSKPITFIGHHEFLQPRKSSMLQDTSHLRSFHATARQCRDHHFDTLKFVQRLRGEGFTEAQSVAMMKVLSDVIEERLIPPQQSLERISS